MAKVIKKKAFLVCPSDYVGTTAAQLSSSQNPTTVMWIAGVGHAKINSWWRQLSTNHLNTAEEEDTTRWYNLMRWHNLKRWRYDISVFHVSMWGYSLLIAPHRSDVFIPSVKRKLEWRLRRTLCIWHVLFAKSVSISFYCIYFYRHINFSTSAKYKNIFAIFGLFFRISGISSQAFLCTNWKCVWIGGRKHTCGLRLSWPPPCWYWICPAGLQYSRLVWLRQSQMSPWLAICPQASIKASACEIEYKCVCSRFSKPQCSCVCVCVDVCVSAINLGSDTCGYIMLWPSLISSKHIRRLPLCSRE